MRIWVHAKDHRIMSLTEPEDNQDYYFCMSSCYFLHVMEEVLKVHKKNNDIREVRAIQNVIDGFKQLGHA